MKLSISRQLQIQMIQKTQKMTQNNNIKTRILEPKLHSAS